MTEEEDWLAPLRAKFAVRLGEEAEKFRNLKASGARDEIIGHAHKLAGLAGMMGAPEVSEVALLLEETARSGADYSGELAELIAAIERARS